MKRRDFVTGVGAGGLWYALGRPLPAFGDGPRDKPNFILILSDDQNWDGLSVRMDPAIEASASAHLQTPHIARLAGQGMRFSQGYAPAPVCSPTRAAIQTGKSPARLHWTKAAPRTNPEEGHRWIEPRSAKDLPAGEVTIAECLKATGYATAHYGKWHLGGGGPEKHGYDESDGDTSNRDAAPFKPPNPVDIFGMGERAARFMRTAAGAGKPFFIQLSYHALHYPENALPETIAKYRRLLPKAKEKEVLRAAIAENLDAGVGKLLAAVDAAGLAESTYVIYLSDNGGGGGGGRRVLRGGKGSVLEGGIRVPFIVRGPGIAAGVCCPTPVTGLDLFPTLCELAGVRDSLPEGVEGGSLVNLFRQAGKGNIQRPTEELVWHFPHYHGGREDAGPQSAIRLGQYKLIRFYESAIDRLYDLSKDSGERRDLSKERPAEIAALGRRLTAYLREVGALQPTRNPDYDPAKRTAPKPRRKDRPSRRTR